MLFSFSSGWFIQDRITRLIVVLPLSFLFGMVILCVSFYVILQRKQKKI
jgi:hypothetical protein